MPAFQAALTSSSAFLRLAAAKTVTFSAAKAGAKLTESASAAAAMLRTSDLRLIMSFVLLGFADMPRIGLIVIPNEL